MPEQPFYKICDLCLHYVQTVESKDKRICTRNPVHVEHLPDDTCGEWTCSRCWISWDMVVQSIEEASKIYIVDHTKCPEITMETKELEMEED